MEKESYYHAKKQLEKELYKHPYPHTIKRIRMAPHMYDWLDRNHINQPFINLWKPGSKTQLSYNVCGYDLPIVKDEGIEKGWIIETKELKPMATVKLTDVTINELPIQAETTLRVVPRMEDVLHAPYRTVDPRVMPHDISVIVEPSTSTGADVHILHGMAQVLIGTGAKPTTVTIEGVNDGQPWVRHKLECHLQEYETESGSIGSRQYARRLVFGVKEHKKTIIEDRVPKVTIMLSEKEAAKIQVMLIDKYNNADIKSTSAEEQAELRHLINHLRKATKEAESK